MKSTKTGVTLKPYTNVILLLLSFYTSIFSNFPVHVQFQSD